MRYSGENLHVLRTYDYPDKTHIVIVSPGEITRSLADRVTQESTCWRSRPVSKYKGTCHARNTLTENGGSTLTSVPHRHPKGQYPNHYGQYLGCEDERKTPELHRFWNTYER